ncbi:rRNA maturation RNase YbeY [Moraxella nasovis]|uniref:rRNA maturation RNase YbeY n=1 Tax=Moraxella nasovis TaxID=2904121 RepID=UPI0035CD1F99
MEQYTQAKLDKVLECVLDVMEYKRQNGLKFAYFEGIDDDIWCKPKQLSVYIADAIEAQELNREYRQKDYATNVLSYPSQMSSEILAVLPQLPLGELVLCHEVVAKQASEQGKAFYDHLVHLLVHGILHLLGFDHELGDLQADEMEGFEIEILAKLGINNPYS